MIAPRIFALFYGDFFPLHVRLLDSLRRSLPSDAALVFWCNQVPERTKDHIQNLGFSRLECIFSPENVPKYKAMRKMFLQPIEEQWIVWFDDDSYAINPGWVELTGRYIESKAAENICYTGQKWFLHWRPGQWDFVKASKWFKGLPPCLIRGKPGVNFATGGYWWLRTDVLRLTGFPDERFSHRGDLMLAEAVRQQGLPFHSFCEGVKINDAKRRGIVEKAIGVL